MIDPRDGLECDECGGCACKPDIAGAYEEPGGRCADCGVPGFVTYDDLGRPFWWPQPDTSGRS